MHRGDEVEPGENRRESQNEDGGGHQGNRAGRPTGAIGGIKSPSGIHRSDDHGGNRHDRTDNPQVKARQVQPRKSHVLGAEHERQNKVGKRAGNRGDDEQEHHDRAVEREETVVSLGRHLQAEQLVLGSQQGEADQERENPAQQECGERADQVHDADALMVDRGHPAPDAPGVVQVILFRARAIPDPRAAGNYRFHNWSYLILLRPCSFTSVTRCTQPIRWPDSASASPGRWA